MTIEELDAQVKKLLEDGVPRIDADDAEPVIRCKDCKYRESWLGIDMVCKKLNLVGVEEDDFCSMAERKE